MGFYVCTIAYDGTDYQGWQRQRHCKNTITQTLESTYQQVFGEKIALVGASRTDAGVHACGQVATFRSAFNIPTQSLMQGWNNKLPDSVSIRSVHEAPEQFHPQRNVLQKTYWYHLLVKEPLPFATRYGWFYKYPVNLEKLDSCLQLFVGTHDFRSFCTGYDMKSTIRTIEHVSVTYAEPYQAYRLEFKGPGFLRYQIRRIVGAAVEVASRPSIPVNYIQQVLESKNQRHTLPNAPAQGLILKEIVYKEESHDTQISNNK